MSIADNIRALRIKNNLTQEEPGEIAGVSSMAVSQWENSRAVPRMGAVQKISDYFGISKGSIIEDNEMDAFIRPKNAHPIVGSKATLPLRVLGKVHAGTMTDEEVITDEIQVPEKVALSHKHAFVLEVEGDCMDRVIPDGSHAVVDPYAEPHTGSIVVVEDENYCSIMRRYYRGSQSLMLSPDSFNEAHQDVIYKDDEPIKLVGTVVWWQAAEMME